MKVTFYGKLAGLLGAQVDYPIEQGCTVAALRSRIAEDYPELGRSLEDRRVRACVGKALVADDYPLTGAEDIEFLAPVSGG